MCLVENWLFPTEKQCKALMKVELGAEHRSGAAIAEGRSQLIRAIHQTQVCEGTFSLASVGGNISVNRQLSRNRARLFSFFDDSTCGRQCDRLIWLHHGTTCQQEVHWRRSHLMRCQSDHQPKAIASHSAIKLYAYADLIFPSLGVAEINISER